MTAWPRTVSIVCGVDRAFTGADFHGPGVGGTEAAVVVFAEELARRGIGTTVFSATEVPVGHRDVTYAPLSAARDHTTDLMIAVKRWGEPATGVSAPVKLFWSTDVHVPDTSAFADAVRRGDGVLLMSDYQRRVLATTVPELRVRPTALVGLPIAVEDYAAPVADRENLLIYCSVPDRGLVYLARWLPAIFRAVPTARLVVTSDYSLWGQTPARDAYTRSLNNNPRVTYAGHVTRAQLVAWQRQAKVMAYPCQFPEGFCLSAAECMAAGAVPVTTDDFALRSTVNDGGILIRGNPATRWTRPLYRRRFVRAVVELLRDDAAWRRRSAATRARAIAEFSPAAVADRVLAFAAERRSATTGAVASGGSP